MGELDPMGGLPLAHVTPTEPLIPLPPLSPEAEQELEEASNNIRAAFEYQAAAEFEAAFAFYHDPTDDSEFAELFDTKSKGWRARFEAEVLIPLQKANPQWDNFDMTSKVDFERFRTKVFIPLQEKNPEMASHDMRTLEGQEGFVNEIILPFLSSLFRIASEHIDKLFGNHLDLQESAEYVRSQEALEQMELQIQQIEAQEKVGFFGKIFKALEVIAIAFSAVTVVMFPSPMTIAMFSLSLGLFIDSTIAESTGEESLMGRFTHRIASAMEGMSDSATNIVATLVAHLTVAVLLLIVTKSASVGMNMAKSGVQAGVKAGSKAATKAGTDVGAQQLQRSIGKMISDARKALLKLDPDIPEDAAKISFLEYLVGALMRFQDYVKSAVNVVQSHYSHVAAEINTEATKIGADMTAREALLNQLFQEAQAQLGKKDSFVSAIYN